MYIVTSELLCKPSSALNVMLSEQNRDRMFSIDMDNTAANGASRNGANGVSSSECLLHDANCCCRGKSKFVRSTSQKRKKMMSACDAHGYLRPCATHLAVACRQAWLTCPKKL